MTQISYFHVDKLGCIPEKIENIASLNCCSSFVSSKIMEIGTENRLDGTDLVTTHDLVTLFWVTKCVTNALKI